MAPASAVEPASAVAPELDVAPASVVAPASAKTEQVPAVPAESAWLFTRRRKSARQPYQFFPYYPHHLAWFLYSASLFSSRRFPAAAGRLTETISLADGLN